MRDPIVSKQEAEILSWFI